MFVYLIFLIFFFLKRSMISQFFIASRLQVVGTVRFLGFQEIKNMFPELRRGINDPCVKVS